jgi:hypothetical protein
MIFSSDELEILDYLKSWKGTSVPFAEISRCAGGRRKFRQSPDWARGLMTRLVDAGLITVNDRGHYRIVETEEISEAIENEMAEQSLAKSSFQVDDNYFPADIEMAAPESVNGIVGEDYFPSASPAPEKKSTNWIASQLHDLLGETGWPFGSRTAEE